MELPHAQFVVVALAAFDGGIKAAPLQPVQNDLGARSVSGYQYGPILEHPHGH